MEEIFSFIFSAIFEGVFNFLLFAPIGFAYLFLRYRDKKRVGQTLANEYENQYANAGRVVVLNTFAAILATVLFVGVISALLSPVIQWFRG